MHSRKEICASILSSMDSRIQCYNCILKKQGCQSEFGSKCKLCSTAIVVTLATVMSQPTHLSTTALFSFFTTYCTQQPQPTVGQYMSANPTSQTHLSSSYTSPPRIPNPAYLSWSQQPVFLSPSHITQSTCNCPLAMPFTCSVCQLTPITQT